MILPNWTFTLILVEADTTDADDKEEEENGDDDTVRVT
jgi:hypothetical protein